MKSLTLTIVTRKIDENWEGAIISDGKFVKALVGKDLYSLVVKQLTGFLVDREDGTEVAIKIDVTKEESVPPGPQKDGQ